MVEQYDTNFTSVIFVHYSSSSIDEVLYSQTGARGNTSICARRDGYG
jgi:hypothetical protein